MTAASVALNALELDAVTELVNLGVSRAAVSLGKLVGAEVLLSVPSVEIVSRDAAARALGQRDDGRLVAVHQLFDGQISGRALLIFSETNSLELVRAMTGDALPMEDILGLEQDALAETGNIILNGCLAVMANMLRRTLVISLPEILYGSSADIFRLSTAQAADVSVMFLCINFSVRYWNIQGHIALLMDVPSFSALRTLLDQLIARESDGRGDNDVFS